MDRPEILENDLVVVRDEEPNVYQVTKLPEDLDLWGDDKPLKKGALVLWYYDCGYWEHNNCLLLKSVLWKVVQVYRMIDGEYRLIWKHEDKGE